MDIFIKRQWFIKTIKGKIEDYYQLEELELSSGSFGKVYRAKSKIMKNEPQRAIKVIPKRMIENKEKFTLEIEILRNLDHPNIIKLYETFEDIRNIYLVMELCTGGELFEHITNEGHFNEKEAQQIFIQIMHAITYCHSKGIAHRDLKPENFLYINDQPNSQLKVIDFGLSRVFRIQDSQEKQLMKSRIGTPYYISPEVLEGKYDELCDIWSAGVILYILLTGIPPFNGNSDKEIINAIKGGKYNMDIVEFSSVSNEVKDLIQKMLAPHQQRLSGIQVLQHKWMQNEDIFNTNIVLNIDSLKKFQKNSKLKKVVLAQIASQISQNEINEYSKLFQSLDKDGNGQLSFQEFKNGFKEKINDLEVVFQKIDTDSSGFIEYNEFIAAVMERTIYLKQDRLLQAFQLFDLDNDGKITAAELKKVLGENEYYQNIDSKFWDQLILEADSNSDGTIDYLEFVEMMDNE